MARPLNPRAAIIPEKVQQLATDSAIGNVERLENVSELAPPMFAPKRQTTFRTSVSGYIFVRGERNAVALSGSGLLGGSQAAIFFEVPRIMSIRGVEIRPVGRVTFAGLGLKPEEVVGGVSARSTIGDFRIDGVVERRVGLMRSGRDALAARASVGIYKAIDQTPLTVSGYVHTGIVGLNRRDSFIEGEGRLVLTEGQKFRRLKPGVALWTSAQPKVSRLDIGPTLDVPILRAPIAISIRTDWRFRIGGNARPGSGPTFTLVAGY